jgi:ABC-type multidrug transport system permease subunit
MLQVTVAHVVFGVPWAGGPTSWVLMATAGATSFAAVGFAIAAVASAPHVANTLANLVFIPMIALGGTALPPSMISHEWAEMAWVLPTATLMEGLLGAFVLGETVRDNLPRLAYLLLWTGATFLLATWRWRGHRVRE